MTQTTYQTSQGLIKVTLERKSEGAITATVGEQTYVLTATQMGEGDWMLETGGRRIHVFTASDGGRRFAHVLGGPVYALKIAEPAARRRGGAVVDAGRLTAQMPGQVAEVLVTQGETVTAGQPLIILEAMKMEIRVAAPSDGVVREIFVRKGDIVEREQQLLSLE